jgi:hypothetical protein
LAHFNDRAIPLVEPGRRWRLHWDLGKIGAAIAGPLLGTYRGRLRHFETFAEGRVSGRSPVTAARRRFGARNPMAKENKVSCRELRRSFVLWMQSAKPNT